MIPHHARRLARVGSHVHPYPIFACCLCCLAVGGCDDRAAPPSSPYRDYVIGWEGCISLCAQLELGHPRYAVATYVGQVDPHLGIHYLAQRRGNELIPVPSSGRGRLADRWPMHAFWINAFSAEVEILEDDLPIAYGYVLIEDRAFDPDLDATRRGQPPERIEFLRRVGIAGDGAAHSSDSGVDGHWPPATVIMGPRSYAPEIDRAGRLIDHYERMRLDAEHALPRGMRSSP